MPDPPNPIIDPRTDRLAQCSCNALMRAKRKGTDCKQNDRLVCLHRCDGALADEADADTHVCCKSNHFKQWMENSRKYYLS